MPAAEFIVGNPPFLGTRLLRNGLGDETVEQLFEVYDGRVSREADFVCYWFEKARAAVKAERAKRVGLVATNSIRGGANRKILDRIIEESRIFEAWSNEPWIVEGAAVRVSLVCFGERSQGDSLRLDGQEVVAINSDLTSTADLTVAKRLTENRGRGFQGPVKIGPFDVPGQLARTWLKLPLNPNGRPNGDVLKPWTNGMDVMRPPSDTWIIDFGERDERLASFYEAPFEHALRHVKPVRDTNRRERRRLKWWQHGETVPDLHAAIKQVSRLILSPRISKHRVFVWIHTTVLPDSATVAIIRDDDTAFGVLHSRFHKAWSLRLGTSLEDRPRYTPTTTFETFPFPEGLTPNIPSKRYADDPRAVAISKAAKHLDDQRNASLNPPDLVRIEPEIVTGYPDRILPKNAEAAVILRERTLTNLYNEYPNGSPMRIAISMSPSPLRMAGLLISPTRKR